MEYYTFKRDDDCREEDIKTIDKLLLIAPDKERSERHSFQERMKLVRERQAIRKMKNSQKEELWCINRIIKTYLSCFYKEKNFNH